MKLKEFSQKLGAAIPALNKSFYKSEGWVGIEIGIQSLGMVYLTLAADKPCIKTHYFNPQVEAQQWEENIKRWIGEQKLEHKPCYLVLPTSAYQIVLIEAPPVAADELVDAARWRVKDMISFPLENTVIDVFELPTDAFRGMKKMIYVVVANKEMVQTWINLIKRIPLQLQAIDIPELTLQNLARLSAPVGKNIALLQLHYDGGIINLGQQDKLYLTRRIEADIRQLDANVSDINTPWLENLLLEIQRSLDFYETHLTQQAAKQLWVLPIPVMSEVIINYLKQNLSIPVHMFDVNAWVAMDLASVSQFSMVEQAYCLRAVGAALRQAGVE